MHQALSHPSAFEYAVSNSWVAFFICSATSYSTFKTSSNITFSDASPSVSTPPSQSENPLPRLWAPQGQGQ